MPSPQPCTSIWEKSLIAPITGEYPYSPSLAKYLQGTCSTGSCQPSRGPVWLLSQQRHDRHRVCPPMTQGELHRSICFNEQVRIMAHLRTTWLSLTFPQMVIQLHENPYGLSDSMVTGRGPFQSSTYSSA